ncbi:MAG: diphosphomevalonate decarboxylase [Crocinitomicaceae bacterium]|nr:diphosphomevalonate decarboxylase [Crocinitomicaceae bacterium]
MENSTEIMNQVKVKWRCPSNIAIVKYWGKKDIQIPCNSSLSLTLSNSFTEVEAELSEKTSGDEVQLNYYFEGELNEQFGQRVAKYLADNRSHFPFLSENAISIHSTNSFPHSAGIASSASAFGAIALAMLDITYTLEGKEKDTEFYQTASNLARLGSGSASRSMFPSYALWGANDKVAGTSNEYALEITDIHPTFKNMKDAILIVEDEPKKVSSSVGHSLMNDHPYASQRFEQANTRTAELVNILKEGNMDAFIQMCESEALTLHAMMMASSEYYLLVKPGTITAIEKLMEFRKESGVPVCFTLDAGPNVHVLYPAEYQEQVEAFINNELADTYKKVIFDQEGQGPQKMNA